jgi:hypothetical protein
MQSSVRRNKFERMGGFVLICINEDTSEVTPLDTEASTQYSYDSTKVSLFSPREEVIQAIMRIKYKDIDSEFAARLNGGTEGEAHAAWRLVAKGVADELTAYVESELNT